jgi:Tol biopolymer transport system component
VSFVNADGTGLQEQRVHLPLGYGPSGIAWSPDGSQLVIWGTFEGSDPREGMYVVNADGSALRQISSGGNDRSPAWSPDGARIAFVRGDQLFTVAADGSDVQVVDGVSPEGAIAWNPVG